MILKDDSPGSNSSNSKKGNKQHQLDLLSKSVSYCINEAECRRVLLLRYFGENFDPKGCNKTCDNCRRQGAVQVRLKFRGVIEVITVEWCGVLDRQL